MRKIKNILFLLLFAVMLVPVATPFLLQLKIILAESDAEERLERNHLEVLRIPVKNILWTKQGKEIIINNRLFDVKEFSRNKKEIVVTGIYDDVETALEKQMTGLWQQQQSKQGIILFKYFQLLSQSHLPQGFLQPGIISTAQKIYPQEIFCYHKEIFIKIPTPPPQIIIIS